MIAKKAYDVKEKSEIKITAKAIKQLKKIPVEIVNSLQVWVDQVETLGLEEVRKISGYHDEPLKGDRKGQQSIRLNKAYRAIYEILNGKVRIISILEVTKHKY